ncbi:MAG: glycosyl transferase, partial [Clostridia bacterium]|nr:glycosyl transferase [Clostridia bacterium]
MKVILYNDSFPPLIDGVANTVVNYADVINKKYGEAMVATPKYPGADDSKFPFYVMRYASLNTAKLVGYRAGFPFGADALHIQEQFAPDLLHSHCPVASTFMARAVRQFAKVPV